MDIQVYTPTIARTRVVQAIMKIRQEWEEAARGESLVEVNGSVGYLLADVAVALGLKGTELKRALGDLAAELTEVLNRELPSPAIERRNNDKGNIRMV